MQQPYLIVQVDLIIERLLALHKLLDDGEERWRDELEVLVEVPLDGERGEHVVVDQSGAQVCEDACGDPPRQSVTRSVNAILHLATNRSPNLNSLKAGRSQLRVVTWRVFFRIFKQLSRDDIVEDGITQKL